MDKRVGLQPVPDDVDIENFLVGIKNDYQTKLSEILDQLRDAMVETKKMNQPEIFAYGKLMNYLASEEISEPTIHKILAAALWELK